MSGLFHFSYNIKQVLDMVILTYSTQTFGLKNPDNCTKQLLNSSVLDLRFISFKSLNYGSLLVCQSSSHPIQSLSQQGYTK